jgi:putative ABC transport system permease protein
MRGALVAVVNETMSRRFWPNGGAVGHAVRFSILKGQPPYGPAVPGSDGWLQIIGVVADARDDGLRNPVLPAVYIPYTIHMQMNTQILVRARVAPLTLLKGVCEKLIQVDPEQQAMKTRDLNEWISGQPELAQQRLVATLFALFSALALALAAVGLYSVVSYGVANRTNEFGVRMALGARRRDVVGIVFTSTSIDVGAGIAAGLALSFALDKIEAKWVTESSRDPLLLLGVSVPRNEPPFSIHVLNAARCSVVRGSPLALFQITSRNFASCSAFITAPFSVMKKGQPRSVAIAARAPFEASMAGSSR